MSSMNSRLPPSIARIRQREYSLSRAAERREWLANYKLERGCELCGFREHAAALDFDHMDRDAKKVGVGMMQMRAWSSIKAEVAKCRVLCANCHRIESARKGHNGYHAWKKDKRQGYLLLGDR